MCGFFLLFSLFFVSFSILDFFIGSFVSWVFGSFFLHFYILSFILSHVRRRVQCDVLLSKAWPGGDSPHSHVWCVSP